MWYFIDYDELFLIVELDFNLSVDSSPHSSYFYIERLAMQKVQVIWPYSYIFLLGGVCMGYSYRKVVLLIKVLVNEREFLSFREGQVVKFQQYFGFGH